MDPLSLSASIAGLISIVDLIAGKSYKYVKVASAASVEVKNLVDQMTDLYGVLCQLRLIAVRYTAESITSTMHVQHLNSCQALVNKIGERLEKADPLKVDNKKSEFRNKASAIGRKLKWPFTAAETKGLVAEVEKQKSTLSLALHADSINNLLDALGDQRLQSLQLKKMGEDLVALRHQNMLSLLSKKEKKILEWVSPYDPSQKHHEIAARLRQPNTGQWFVDSDDFKHWLTERGSKLWIHGIPGAGKTVLIGFIVEFVVEQLKKSDGLAFYYCDYKDPKTQEPRAILGSLVKQLALTNKRALKAVGEYWERHSVHESLNTQVPISAEQLCDLLRSLSAYFDNIHIIVDALDECGDPRAKVVEHFASLNTEKDCNIKLLLASRAEPDIERVLQNFAHSSIVANKMDLKLYVHSEMERRLRDDTLNVQSETLKEEIMAHLVDRADGMFRWVTCQFDHLSELNTDRDIREALTRLPPTLFSTYERILDRVNSSHPSTRELVRRSLLWIASSKEPLSAWQLREAVSLELSSKTLYRDRIPDEKRILKWCSSLVRRTGPTDAAQIELAHFTVKEFLLLEFQEGDVDKYAQYRISIEKANLHLAQLCLTYILSEDFENLPISTIKTEEEQASMLKAQNERHPLLLYASKNFCIHAMGNEDDEALWQLLQSLFQPAKTNNYLSWSYQFANITLHSGTNIMQAVSSSSTLHFAALVSLPCVVRWLTKLPECYPNINKMSEIGTPLACALFSIHSQNASPNPPKHNIMINGSEVIDSLLEGGADVNARAYALPVQTEFTNLTSFGGSAPKLTLVAPLELTILKDAGWELLLKHGALVTDSCIDVLEISPELLVNRFLATVEGKSIPTEIYPRFLRLLQQYNVSGDHNHKITDISIPISESTLHTAAEFGQTYEVMQLLQKPDLDIDAYVLSVEGGLTSLHYAVKNGHLDIVKALLAHGASIDIPTTVGNAKICKGKSPFLLALIYGHIDVARFLEAKGADINKSDAAGQTAVHLATRHNVAMLDYLLHIPKQSHTLSSKTAHGKTVLMDAAYWGICDTFAYVLNHSGVESIVSQGNNGENCLHWAVKSMSQNTAHKIIQMLKDTAIDPYIRDHAGYTPLHCAAMESRYSVFKAILEYTEKWSLAEPSIHDPFIFTTIIGYPYLQDFRSQWLPHNIGARTLEHLTSSGKSVIHLILERPMSKENLCKIQLLMKKGINMDFQDARGRTPLLALCSRIGDGDPNAEVEAFELLLSHTANIAHQDFDGNTPLHYLCQRAYHQELACRCILYILEVSSRYDETHQSIAMDQYLDRDRRPHFPAAELDGKSSVNSLVYTSRKPSAKSDLIALMNNNEANALSLFFELRNLSHPTAFETALKLLEATSQVQLNSVFPNGKCPLIISIRQGIDSLTRKLIDMGADVTASEGPPIIRPISALEQLCISGSKDLSVIKSIVYGNKNSFPRNTSGESRLLEIACTNGHISVLEQLLIAGWNPNSLREDHSPLFSALRSGHEQALVLLLDYGASISDEICGYLSLGEASSAALCKVLHDRGIDDWDLRNKRKNYFWGPWIKGLSNEFRRVWLTRPIGEIAPLHYAAWRGSTECIEYALEFGKYVNINVHAEFNLTPLFFAVFGGHQSSVELLLGHGANAKEIYKPYGWTPLHVAVSSGSIAAVTKLMGAGADGRISDFDGITPSMLAKQQGKTSIAQVIDTETAKLPPLANANEVSQAPVSGSSAGTDQISLALETAIIEGDMALCDLLIGEGQSLKGLCHCGCSPVLKALKRAFFPLAKFLIDKGASLDGVVPCLKSPFFGFTPLHYAALSGDAEMTLKILSIGCNYESQPVQPIHIAALNGYAACVELLCKTGNSKTVIEAKVMDPSISDAPLARLLLRTDLTGSYTGFGETALHLAASQGHVGTIEVLLAAAADPNSRDDFGYTPLHEAVSGNHIHASRILIAAGANIDAARHDGYSPIMVAAAQNSSELTKLLASLGADLTHREQNGRDVLHIAAEAKSVDVMEILVDLGLDVQSSDYFSNTAIKRAINSDIEENICIKFLPEVDTSCHSLDGNLLNEAAYNDSLEIGTELLKRQPTEKRIQYVNAPSVRGAPLYVTSTFGKKEVAFKFMELLINYGADINLASGPQGTPIMAACYYGRYDSVAFLLKKGARTTYRRLDGTQVTALECGKNHPEIQQLLMNFEQRGVEALDEPLLAVKADMTKVQECMAQIKEELTMQSNKSESDHDSESDGDSDSNDQTEDDDDGGTDNDKGKNDNEEDDGSSKSMDENEDKDGETTHTFAE